MGGNKEIRGFSTERRTPSGSRSIMYVALNVPKDLNEQKIIGDKLNSVPEVLYNGGSTEGHIIIEAPAHYQFILQDNLPQDAVVMTWVAYQKSIEKKRKEHRRQAITPVYTDL